MAHVRRFIAGLGREAATLLAAATLLGALVPLVLWGYPDSGDANVHLAWYQAFAAQFWAGDLLPRWLESIIWGLGAPIFYFYPPLAYYAGALMQPLDGGSGWQAMGWGAALGLVISAVSAFFWLHRYAARRAALFAALIYAVMPYHLGVDLFERSAFGEFWAFVWLPLIPAFIDRLERGWAPFAGLGLAYAALILTHLPTALLMTLPGAAYAVFRHGRSRHLGRTLAALVLGGILAAFHWLPAMVHLDWTHADLLWGGMAYYFEIDRLIGAAGTLWAGNLERYMFHHLALLVPVALLAMTPAATAAARFWRIAGALMIVMMTPLAALFWDYVPLMSKVQFAWRLHAILCLAAAFLAATAFAHAARAMILVAALVLVLDLMAMASFSRFGEARLLDRVERFHGAMEFLPATAPLGPTRATLMAPLKGDWPRAAASPGVTARIARWEPGDIVLAIDARTDGTITVGQLYFPLWRAEFQGRSVPLNPSPDNGRLQLHLPAGEGIVHLYLARTPWMQAGRALSALALAVILGLALSGACQTVFERRRQIAH